MSGKYARKSHGPNAVLAAWALFAAAVVVAVAVVAWVWPDVISTLMSETFWQNKTVIVSAMAVCVLVLVALLLSGRTPKYGRSRRSKHGEHSMRYGARMW